MSHAIMDKKLRAAVIGSGVFGGYHAHKYKSFSDISLVGVGDVNLEQAEKLAKICDCMVFDAQDRNIFNKIDILTIATPAFSHAKIAIAALDAGVHVYCEKPIALCADEAQAMVDAALKSNSILAIGHQERVVFEAMGLYSIDEKPLRLEAVRNGTLSLRNLDVSVTLDLMIHDLDLALGLSDSHFNTVQVHAHKHTIDKSYLSQGADQVTAEVTFGSGMTSNFTASRVNETRERTMKLFYPQGEVFIDFLNRKFENSTPYVLNPDFSETPMARDPLGTSVRRFIDSAKAISQSPLCSGSEGLKALVLAEEIDRLSGF
jgi:predicted dehydrogenase